MAYMCQQHVCTYVEVFVIVFYRLLILFFDVLSLIDVACLVMVSSLYTRKVRGFVPHFASCILLYNLQIHCISFILPSPWSTFHSQDQKTTLKSSHDK